MKNFKKLFIETRNKLWTLLDEDMNHQFGDTEAVSMPSIIRVEAEHLKGTLDGIDIRLTKALGDNWKK